MMWKLLILAALALGAGGFVYSLTGKIGLRGAPDIATLTADLADETARAEAKEMNIQDDVDANEVASDAADSLLTALTCSQPPTISANVVPSGVCMVTLSGSGAGCGICVSYTWDNGITDGDQVARPLSTTTYTVTGTDMNGCVATATVDVTAC